VLKRAGVETEANFVATVSSRLPMVAVPVPSTNGGWLQDGWVATAWADGKPDPSRWDDVLEIGRELHEALAAVDPPWPPELDNRATPWAIADRVAWGEQSIPDTVTGLAADVTERALGSSTAGVAPLQVVHGDLAANVLFPTDRPPVVIDLSPYFRPVSFATAVAVLDQVSWYGAPVDRATLVDRSDLARAIVFRVVAAALHSSSAGDEEARRGQRLLD
jgi:uncharacterized protein (TIGR02569 family)